MDRLLQVLGYSRARHQLAFRYRLDDLRFQTTFWYEDADLYALEARFGQQALERIYFHVALFDVNKLCSLAPAAIDLGPFAPYHTAAFEELWRTVLHHVWAQWRYENDLPGYAGPEFLSRPAATAYPPLEPVPGPVDSLVFCGGGKDSLVAMKALEEADLAFATYAYSDSIYGTAAPQHALIEKLCAHVAAARHHRSWAFDDVLDSPIAALAPEYGPRTLLAAETPRSIFAALPIALAHGYRHLIVGHEKSADAGNLTWTETGEEVNHQWGKSLAAERLLAAYVEEQLVAGCAYFSVLKPIHDVLIFNLLRSYADCAGATHSCNVKKPWCCRCAKCAYVWLGYRAYLPPAVVEATFPHNLFDLEENQLFFEQLLGLADRTPFECVGEVDETRLAFELCRRLGFGGRAMETFVRRCPAIDYRAVAERYLTIHRDASTMPEDVARRILPRFERARRDARGYVGALLSR
ncbi:MAG: hypothetical protein D6696_07910 [Acidobacteria bacterium]|nr:MAG: hypothetical protein D6696_07910 [Acidobacteriota bacterium]